MDSTYSLAISNYVVNGGDKVDSFSDTDVISTGTAIDVDVFAEYIKRHRTIPPVEASDNPDRPAQEGSADGSSDGSSRTAIITVGAVVALLGALAAFIPKSVWEDFARYLWTLVPPAWR